jgi:hypothetical protein
MGSSAAHAVSSLFSVAIVATLSPQNRRLPDVVHDLRDAVFLLQDAGCQLFGRLVGDVLLGPSCGPCVVDVVLALSFS